VAFLNRAGLVLRAFPGIGDVTFLVGSALAAGRCAALFGRFAGVSGVAAPAAQRGRS
jgi:hypothetical protein